MASSHNRRATVIPPDFSPRTKSISLREARQASAAFVDVPPPNALLKLFKSTVQRVIVASRMENAGRILKHHGAATAFYSGSAYKHVREALDPVKHRHLLGDEVKSFKYYKPAATTASQRKRSMSIAKIAMAKVFADRRVASFKSTSTVELLDGMLPSGTTVAQMPPEMQQTIEGVAVDKLRSMLLPRLCLYERKRHTRERTAQFAALAARPPIEYLRRLQLFLDWPTDALNFIVNSLSFMSKDAGEIILHEGEPPGAGIWIVTNGSCQLLSKKKGNVKRVDERNANHIASLIQTPYCFNEFQFMTKEPRVHSVKTLTRCDVWVVSRDVFDSALNMLTLEQQRSVEQRAFAKHVAHWPKVYPMSVSLLREYPIFSGCSTPLLEALIPSMKPLAVPAGHTFGARGEASSSILFVRVGTVGTFREIGDEELHLMSATAPCLINYEQVLHGESSTDVRRSITSCDLYELPRSEFIAVTSSTPAFIAERREMIVSSRKQHTEQHVLAQARFRPLVYNVPLVGHFLRVDQLNAMTQLFESRVHPPLSIVCSTSEMCNRLIILVKGKVSLGIRGKWEVGEGVGFTCVLSHRWACPAVAMDPVETIEINRELFIAFLKDCGVFERYVDVVRQLLHPVVDNDAQIRIKRRIKAAHVHMHPTNDSQSVASVSVSPIPRVEQSGFGDILTSSPSMCRMEKSCSFSGFGEKQPATVATLSPRSRAVKESIRMAVENPVYRKYIRGQKTPPMFPVAPTNVSTALRAFIPIDKTCAVASKSASIPTEVRSEDTTVESDNTRRASQSAPSQALTLPSLHLIPGCVRMPLKMRREIAQQVARNFDPGQHRRLQKVTKYLWIKQREN